MTDEAIEDIKSTQTKTAKGTKEPINMWQRLVGGLHWMDGKENTYTEEGYYNALKNNRVGYDASGIKKGICDAAVRVLGESKSTIINANIQVIPEKQKLMNQSLPTGRVMHFLHIEQSLEIGHLHLL